jgi:bacillopeptidase F
MNHFFKTFVAFFFSLLFIQAAQAENYSENYIVTYENHNQSQNQAPLILNRSGQIQLLRLKQVQNEQMLVEALGSGVEIISSLWLVNASEIKIQKSQLKNLIKLDFIKAIQPVRTVKLINFEQPKIQNEISFPEYTYGLNIIGLKALQQKYPDIRGQGVRVGILDTGLDTRHPAFKNKTVTFRNFVNPKDQNPIDDHSHGTHVAGTVSALPVGKKYVGIAPDVNLIIGKVFSKTGSSSDAETLKALQWMADPDGNPDTQDHAQVINNSWNVDYDEKNKNPYEDLFCIAVKNLKDLSIISVFAAGNDGPDDDTIKVPGSCADAVTVAATDVSDAVVSFSSRGPVLWPGGKLDKPDLAAPGYQVYSTVPGSSFSNKSGTSMAAPHVTGALALLLQINSDPQLAVETLLNNTTDFGAKGFDYKFGRGRLDVLKASESLLSQ